MHSLSYFRFHHQHQRQLDPTEIIAVPYDLQRLSVYVAAVMCVVLLDPANGGWHKFVEILQLTVSSFVIFILCGASPKDNLFHTVLAAAYFATLCWFDPPVFAANTPTTISAASPSRLNLYEQFIQRYRGRSLRGSQDVVAMTVLHSTVAVTIPLQILLLYDAGLQVQRWPVPVILGSTIGWIMGTILGTILATTRRFSYKKEEDIAL